jgi:hypothetical protein
VKGIEPSYSAWEAAALPLSYTRAASFIGCPDRFCQARPPGPNQARNAAIHRNGNDSRELARNTAGGHLMNSIIYLIGLVVVVLAILAFFGLA